MVSEIKLVTTLGMNVAKGQPRNTAANRHGTAYPPILGN